MVVSKPPATDRKGQSMNKYNPVSHWRLSTNPITGERHPPLENSQMPSGFAQRLES
jgi:hypothetical protein